MPNIVVYDLKNMPVQFSKYRQIFRLNKIPFIVVQTLDILLNSQYLLLPSIQNKDSKV